LLHASFKPKTLFLLLQIELDIYQTKVLGFKNRLDNLDVVDLFPNRVVFSSTNQSRKLMIIDHFYQLISVLDNHQIQMREIFKTELLFKIFMNHSPYSMRIIAAIDFDNLDYIFLEL